MRCKFCLADSAHKIGYVPRRKPLYQCEACGKQFSGTRKEIMPMCRVCGIVLDEENANPNDKTLCRDEGQPYVQYPDLMGKYRFDMRNGNPQYVLPKRGK